jgi:PAS domain S-box-containing protein
MKTSAADPARDAAALPLVPDGGDDELAQEHKENLAFFAAMDRVNRTVLDAVDLTGLLRDVLDVVLDELDCDRAWLVYPCDPDATTWTAPMERTRPRYPGTLALGIDVPNGPATAAVFRRALSARAPEPHGGSHELPVPDRIAREFGVQSSLSTAVFPRGDRAWLFGVHQCSRPRTWTVFEQKLLQAIGRRLGDALAGMLAARQVKESELRYRQVFEGTSDAMVLLDAAADRRLRVAAMNPAAERLLRVRSVDAAGVLAEEIAPHGRMLAAYRVCLDARKVLTFEDELSRGRERRTLDTTLVPVTDESGAIYRVVAVLRDVTERKRLEEALRQAQKMEAFGQLAAGIAHDFNNLLTVMQGGLDHVRGGAADERAAAIADIDHAAMRAGELTRQLLAFSRQQAARPRTVSLDDVVSSTARMLERLLPADVRLSIRPSGGEPQVFADPGMLEQVIVNLVLNARDAMPTGGAVDVSVRSVTRCGPEASRSPAARAGHFVCLSVADTGAGIAPEHLDRIFEPFFTTKEAGRGTGLGLAIVFGIVDQASGWVDVESSPGGGTTFTVVLPRDAHAHEAPAPVRDDAEAPRGDELILLAEDESSVRGMVTRILTRAGYRVVATASGNEALEVWNARREEFRLVLTDFVMPGGLSGPELARAVVADRPGFPVLFMSGFAPEALRGEGGPAAKADVLTKPFAAADLLARVRQLLDESSTAEHGDGSDAPPVV